MGTAIIRRSGTLHSSAWFVPAVLFLFILLHVPCLAQGPVLQKLDPPGGQLGEALVLKLVGRNLPADPKIITPLPATFTPMTSGKSGSKMQGAGRQVLPYLVEFDPDVPVGLYPIRLSSPQGLSNILLFSVGAFPEVREEESLLTTHQALNDSPAASQELERVPVTVTGTLKGPDRDVYRFEGHKGDELVLAVEARRAGSGLDPLIRLLDAREREIASNDDAPGLDVDCRLDVLLPDNGPYYVVIHDSRFGIWLSETMPKLAGQVDKCTLIRSMSYTPKGLFNHTAAIYQMLTGFPPDRVSPSGQLEPPSPADFPTAGSHISKLLPPTEPVLPFVELPRPLQESQVIGKGGSAGFLGKAYDPYRLYQDPNQTLKLEDLELRKEVPAERLQDRFTLLKGINGSMPDLEKAVESHALDEYYEKALDLVLSGKARDAFDLEKEPDEIRNRYGRTTFGQGALLARRLIEAGTRFVQLNWPAVANGRPEVDAWDTHASNFGPLKNLHCPVLDQTLSALLEDMHDRGLLEETLVVAVGEFGRSPQLGVSTSGNANSPDGRDHWPYCYTAMVAGAGMPAGRLYGESDATASAPREKPVHPNDLLATIYYSLGIDPEMEIRNHLDQPRELVKGEVLSDLWI